MPKLGIMAVALLVMTASGCTPASSCPRTVEEAKLVDWDDEIVAGGYVIRYIPAPNGPERGYDINVSRPVSERASMDTYFLRTPIELAGIEDGMPVLLIGARTDRDKIVVQGAECPVLTPTTDEDVTRPFGDD
jgi:hypothetical protein